jgi:EAL domain-containing protein (putative c-di-GMP-specific phosphodiesterase class I)
VAEGIETEQDRGLLIDGGCGYGQGFLFARHGLAGLPRDDARGRQLGLENCYGTIG